MSGLEPDRRFRLTADGYEPVEITSLIDDRPDANNDQMIVQMRRLIENDDSRSD